MALYEELVEYMEDNFNSNFHISTLSWEMRTILQGFCTILDKKLEAPDIITFTSDP